MFYLIIQYYVDTVQVFVGILILKVSDTKENTPGDSPFSEI